MIRKRKQKTDRVTVIELSGIVSDRDFEAVFDDHADETSKPKETVAPSAHGLVIIANEDFEGFSGSSVLGDLAFFFRHRDDFKRIALVADNPWIRAGVHLVGGLAPFDIKVFKLNETDAAIDWSGSDGLTPIHRINRGKGIVTIKPRGELEKGELEWLGRDVDEYLKTHKKINGVLIEAKAFPGWHSFSALAEHLRFVKGHQSRVRRISIVTDDPMLQRLPPWAEIFLTAEVRSFASRDRRLAQLWIASHLPEPA